MRNKPKTRIEAFSEKCAPIGGIFSDSDKRGKPLTTYYRTGSDLLPIPTVPPLQQVDHQQDHCDSREQHLNDRGARFVRRRQDQDKTRRNHRPGSRENKRDSH